MVDNAKKAVDPEKEIKKLIESHMVVLKDKLGRAPTADEISKALGGKGEEETSTPITEDAESSTAEPKILKLKAYYGMGTKKTDNGDVKEPDKNKVLYYEHGDGRCFDCSNQQWAAERPPLLDHLPSRPLMFDSKNTDIIRAIVNGVVDDEDFTELDKSGALTDDSRKIFLLSKRAKEISEQLEKSEEVELSQDDMDDAAQVAPDGAPVVREQTGIDVVKAFMDTAGVQQSLEVIQENFGQDGANLFEEILKAALADVDEKTRMLVREEMDAYMAPVLDAIESLAQHMGLQIDLSEPADSHQPAEDEYYNEDSQKEMDDMQLGELTDDEDDDTIDTEDDI